MYKQQSSKYSLFLMELIIVIFFFTIASAVCVQLYAEAHILSTSTRDLNNAITRVEGAAEVIKSSPINPEEALLLAYDNAIITDKQLQVGYTKDWETVLLNEAVYILTIDWQTQDQMLSATIRMEKVTNGADSDNQTIYRLDVVKHIPITLN